MTWVVDPAIEAVVRAAAADVVGEPRLAAAALARAVVDRSRRYTSDRDRLARPDDPLADLAARAAFFTVADAAKIAVPLAELAGREALPARDPLRVVDVGAGCGAMSLGAASALPRALAIVAIDLDTRALAIASAALRALPRTAPLEVTTRVADVRDAAIPTADLVILGSVLNELSADAALAVVDRALAAIADDGAVIVIEPALRETSRALHAVRDAVLARALGHVFAPCTRTGTPCPALADPDDWCHEDRPIALPPRTAELARATHLRDNGMKFSYLVLRRSPRPLVDEAPAYRVVSAQRAAKGKLEMYGCGDAGRVTLRLLRRHRDDRTRPFERADRGDVVISDAPIERERVELGEGATLLVRTPARR